MVFADRSLECGKDVDNGSHNYDLPMEGMEAIKDPDLMQSPITQALLWAIGVLLAITGWFIIRELSRQQKKDESQDDEIDKLGLILESTNKILGDMREMLARHDTNIEWLMKSIEKSTRK